MFKGKANLAWRTVWDAANSNTKTGRVQGRREGAHLTPFTTGFVNHSQLGGGPPAFRYANSN